jgi:hypothetical protein
MLKVFGHIYSDDSEDFMKLINVLEQAGYSVAFDYPTNATIIKEVEDE